VILGIGVDIVELRRIKKIIEDEGKKESFLNKLFNDEEIEYFKSRNFKVEYIAGRFAAKEAVSKALGTGFRNFEFKDITITRDELGKPEVILKNNAHNIAREKGKYKFHISISHGEDSAIAYVIMEQKVPGEL